MRTIILTTTLLFLVVSCLGSDLQAEDWPQWRGVRADGTWRGPSLQTKWPADGLPTLWKQPVGGGYGGIAVAEGRAYLLDRQKEPAESERLLCFQAETGEPLWTNTWPVAYDKLDYGNGPRCTPTFHEGRVYLLGAVGHLRCVDAKTGETQWAHDLVQDFGAVIPQWGLAASPLIWKDLVILHPGAKAGGSLMAFDRTTGKEVWRASSDPAGYATPILIERPSGPQLVAWTPENILGIEPRTGRIDWQVPYKVTYGVSIATPLYHDGIVFVSGYWEGSKAIRLGEKAGEAKLIWEENKFLRGLMAPPLVRDGLVYSLDKQYGLTCFELLTGKKLWDDGNMMTPRDRNPQASFIALGDSSQILALNAEGELLLAEINAEGYHELARTKIIGPTWAHLSCAGETVFARNDQELVCVRLPVVEN